MALPAVALSGALALVAPGPAGAGESNPTPCEKLAQVFHAIARYRDRGDPKESQASWVREQFGQLEASAEARLFERAIDSVYARRDSGDAIGEQVLAGGSLDADGGAVVRLSQ